MNNTLSNHPVLQKIGRPLGRNWLTLKSQARKTEGNIESFYILQKNLARAVETLDFWIFPTFVNGNFLSRPNTDCVSMQPLGRVLGFAWRRICSVKNSFQSVNKTLSCQRTQWPWRQKHFERQSTDRHWSISGRHKGIDKYPSVLYPIPLLISFFYSSLRWIHSMYKRNNATSL